MILSPILRFAPNIAGICYTTGNLILLLTGGIAGNMWQIAAGLLWTLDGIIFGLFGRTARGIEIHAAVNIAGCVCFIIAALALADPFGQVAFAAILIGGSLIKIIAPAADTQIQKPAGIFALPGYYIKRYPLSVVACIAMSSRPFFIWGTIANAQWILLIAGILWALGDIFQFLSRKGGYIKAA